MKTDTIVQRKEEIISTAFSVWGKTRFMKTPLSSIARAMDLSKTALYRYFPNKQSLMERMEYDFAEAYNAHLQGEIDHQSFVSFEELVKRISSSFIEFFLLNPQYFFFFVLHIMSKPMIKNIRILNNFEHLREKLQEAARQEERVRCLFEGDLLGMHFLFITSLYWVGKTHKNELPVSHELVRQLNRQCSNALLHGYWKGNSAPAPDRKKCRRICTLEDSEKPEPDRIFKAISETVAEVGFQEASTDKIAQKLGMKKSSLYFYFENKNDMMRQMVSREQEHLHTLFVHRLKECSNLEEGLLCYFLITGAYLLENPAVLTTFNWLRLQKIYVDVQSPDLDFIERHLAFLKDDIAKGAIELHGLTLQEIAAYMGLLIIREVMESHLAGENINQAFNKLETMYTLFLTGFSNWNNKKPEDLRKSVRGDRS